MSSDTTFKIDETKIKQMAEQIIQRTCDAHGVTRDALKPEALEDAYASARARVEHEAELVSNPHFQALEAEREENRLLRMQLEALKQNRPTVQNVPDPVQVDIVKARMGAGVWNQMTDQQRLAAIGVPPASIDATTKEEIKRLFGPKSDSYYSSNFFKQSPGRYKALKQIGKALNII